MNINFMGYCFFQCVQKVLSGKTACLDVVAKAATLIAIKVAVLKVVISGSSDLTVNLVS